MMIKNMENNNCRDQNIEDNIKKLDGNIFHISKKYGWLPTILFLAVMFGIAVAAPIFRNPYPSLVLFYLAAFIIIYLEKRGRDKFMRQFAQIAGFQYNEKIPAADVAAPYLQIGYNRSLEDVVGGIFQNYPARFFNFNCVVGEGKSRHTITFTAAQIGYKATLPHIFLDAHHHYFTEEAIFSLKNPVENDKNEEFLKLEGNFNKYFTLYAPKGYEIETLQILTPDIMQDLIEYSKNFSLEIYGSNLYIYSRKVITNGKNLCALYDLAKFLAAKVAPEIEKIRIEAIPTNYSPPGKTSA
jgi:hypothetical protein